MTENITKEDTTETDKEAIAASEQAAIIMPPPDKSAQASYCVKTVQENSASVIRMVS